MPCAGPLPALNPAEAAALDAFLQPEATLAEIAQRLRTSIHDLVRTLAAPAVRAALDTLAELDAIRRRLHLAPLGPASLNALQGLLDRNENPVETRRVASALLTAVTRSERFRPTTSRLDAVLARHALAERTAPPDAPIRPDETDDAPVIPRGVPIPHPPAHAAQLASLRLTAPPEPEPAHLPVHRTPEREAERPANRAAPPRDAHFTPLHFSLSDPLLPRPIGAARGRKAHLIAAAGLLSRGPAP